MRGCPRADRPAGGVFSGVSGPIDCVASFRPLAAEDLAKIAALQLRELAGRLQKQNVTLETAPELPECLGALCANEPGGARSLRRRLQTGIEGPAAELLLRNPSVRTLRAVWQQGACRWKRLEDVFKTFVQKFGFRGFFTKNVEESPKNFFKKGLQFM
ncbi:MAG: hypothetical protein ACLS3C_05305 [Oscillospiraceae bacterium]